MGKYYINWSDIEILQEALYDRIHEYMDSLDGFPSDYIPKVYGYPRGGAVVAALFLGYNGIRVVHDIIDADLVVEDIVDSGRTAKRIFEDHQLAVFGLIDKRLPEHFKEYSSWVVFPWEESPEEDIENSVVRILEYLGEDPNRDGLQKTPYRVVKSWKEIYGGYQESDEDILSTAFDNDGSYDQMVVLKDIEFYSMCEHHMLPFVGKASIAYIPKPDGKVVGISKLARLVEMYARRLQIQEKMTEDIADSLMANLDCLGVAVSIEAQHFCMKMRGVRNHSSWMKTTSLKGCFKAEPGVREEFYEMIK